jgi:hypothetical protein
MRRIVPLLRAAGYNVTDFSQSSWLATPENIAILSDKLKKAVPDENTTVILELFGNSTYRYRQFDGTMALPFKASNGYHLEGDVGVCDDEIFLKLVGTTKELFDAVPDCVKIVVPPLPRHLYTPCCNNRKHCTNFKSESYELGMLQATTHFRPILKDAVQKMGIRRFFVLDGVGGLLGIPAGENRGAASEIIRELKNYCGPDGVHYAETGYANLARTIISAMEGIIAGTLTKSPAEQKGISGTGGGGSFFWRGFISPVGHAGIKSDRHHAHDQARASPVAAGPGPRTWQPDRGRGYSHHGGYGGYPDREHPSRDHSRDYSCDHSRDHNRDHYASFKRGGRRGRYGPHPYHRQ